METRQSCVGEKGRREVRGITLNQPGRDAIKTDPRRLSTTRGGDHAREAQRPVHRQHGHRAGRARAHGGRARGRRADPHEVGEQPNDRIRSRPAGMRSVYRREPERAERRVVERLRTSLDDRPGRGNAALHRHKSKASHQRTPDADARDPQRRAEGAARRNAQRTHNNSDETNARAHLRRAGGDPNSQR